MSRLEKELAALKEQSLYRKRMVIEPPRHFPIVTLDGRDVVSFASNNYLGLHHRPLLNEPLVQMASPLVTGYTSRHFALEQRLAIHKGSDAALLFSSGFTANAALLSTLVGPKDAVLLDKYCHASLMEVTRDPSKNFHSFPHKRYDLARKQLEKMRPQFEVIYLVSDTIFSMEGDEADLKELVLLAHEFDALLVLDDAHAFGVAGEQGEGLATFSKLLKLSSTINELSTRRQGANPAGNTVEDHLSKSLIITGTLSKAIAAYGGFVCATKTVIDYLINKARPYIYNTALPLVHVEAAIANLDTIALETPQHVLWKNIAYFCELLHLADHKPYSPIIKIPVGDNEKALLLSESLLKAGMHVPAIRYPTVPRNDAMLRVSVSAAHTFEQLRTLAEALTQGTISP